MTESLPKLNLIASKKKRLFSVLKSFAVQAALGHLRIQLAPPVGYLNISIMNNFLSFIFIILSYPLIMRSMLSTPVAIIIG